MADSAASFFLDANVVMELFFARDRRSEVLDELALHGSEVDHVVSISSVDLLLYYVEKEKKVKQDAHNFMKRYGILDMNEADYEWAAVNDQGDFEDALQVACALRHKCKKLVTLDADLAKRHNKHIAVKLVR